MRRPDRCVRATLFLVVALAVAAVAYGDERVDITATDGVQLIGHLSGASGPGVVLVRDPARESGEWQDAAEALAKGGLRVLRFDLRGHGESEGAADAATIDRDAEGAFRYLIGRKIRPVYLVGEGASAAAVATVAGRVAATRVVMLGDVGAPTVIPTVSGARVERLPGDLADSLVREALAKILHGRTSD